MPALSDVTTLKAPRTLILGGDAQQRDEVALFAGATTMHAGTLLGRVSSSGALRAWSAEASDGIEFVRAVLAHDVEALSAGEIAVRVIVAGTINASLLIIDADGTGTNITAAVLDQLRDCGIEPVDVQPLSHAVAL